ncbi:MAG: PilZ domain-containing protein [Planctomycetota bacterium]|jgi:hypothetical protein
MKWPLTERRAHLRCNLRVKMEVELPENPTSDPSVSLRRCAFTRNIGCGGVVILSSIPIPEQTKLKTYIPIYKFDETLRLNGEVTRCESTDLGYEIAVMFLELNEASVSLISRLVDGTGRDVNPRELPDSQPFTGLGFAGV